MFSFCFGLYAAGIPAQNGLEVFQILAATSFFVVAHRSPLPNLRPSFANT